MSSIFPPMNYLINELFLKVKAEQEQISANAITDLCCLLEMKTWNLDENDRISRYGSLLSQKIIKLQIDESEEKEIVNFLQQEIEKGHKYTSGLLFALGQASSKIALKPLINVITNYLNKFEEEEVYQALVSLERLIFWNEDLSPKEKKEMISKTNLMEIISKKILSFSPIIHSDLESTFLRLFADLILLLDDTNSEIGCDNNKA